MWSRVPFLMILAMLVAAPLAWGQDAQPKSPAKQSPAPRTDKFYGTTHEGVVMERNEQGDLIMQVAPRPKNQADQSNETGQTDAIDVEPVVIVPVTP